MINLDKEMAAANMAALGEEVKASSSGIVIGMGQSGNVYQVVYDALLDNGSHFLDDNSSGLMRNAERPRNGGVVHIVGNSKRVVGGVADMLVSGGDSSRALLSCLYGEDGPYEFVYGTFNPSTGDGQRAVLAYLAADRNENKRACFEDVILTPGFGRCITTTHMGPSRIIPMRDSAEAIAEDLHGVLCKPNLVQVVIMVKVLPRCGKSFIYLRNK